MPKRLLRILGCFAVALGPVLLRGQETPTAAPAFRDGARWCFAGDDLTEDGSYLSWFRCYVITRFPDRTIEIFNAGVSGDSAASGLSRFSWDVAAVRPTDVVIGFSVDDAGEPSARTETAWRSWVDQVRRLPATPWLMPPPGRDGAAASDVSRPWLRQLAVEADLKVVEIETALRRARLAPPSAAARGPTAGVAAKQSDAAAQLVIGWALLKAAGAPAEVAGLNIDLRAGQFAASNSTVARVTRGANDLSFEWTAKALPLPIGPDLLAAAKDIPVVEDLNREILQVSGLKPGRWMLTIDGTAVATFSHTQLEQGVNLATEPTAPQSRQAHDVMRLLEAHARLVAENLRPIAGAEHRLAPDEPRPVAAERILALLAGRRAAAGGSAEWEREPFALYEQRKARQAVSASAAGRLIVQARRAAQPQPHLYLLRFQG